MLGRGAVGVDGPEMVEVNAKGMNQCLSVSDSQWLGSWVEPVFSFNLLIYGDVIWTGLYAIFTSCRRIGIDGYRSQPVLN